MVVFILVVLWAAVLGPLIVRRLRDEEPLGSVDSFYHELHLLERAAPKTVAPANRLATAPTGGLAPGSSGYPSVSSLPRRPSLVLLRPVGSPDGDVSVGSGWAAAAPGQPECRRLAVVPGSGPVGVHGPGVREPSSLAARDHAYQVRRCRRRRRDILLGLLATAVVTGPLGTIHSFRTLWVFTVLSMVLLVAYLYLLVRTEQAARAKRAPHRSTAAPGRAPGSPVPATERAVARGDRRTLAGGDHRATGGRDTRRSARRDARRYRPAVRWEDEEWQEQWQDVRQDPPYLRRLAGVGEPSRWDPEEDVGWAARAGYPGAWDNELDMAQAHAPAQRRLAAGG